MNKYSISALAFLRMDGAGPLCYSIVTERKQPEIRNHRKFQVSHFQKEPKKARKLLSTAYRRFLQSKIAGSEPIGFDKRKESFKENTVGTP